MTNKIQDKNTDNNEKEALIKKAGQILAELKDIYPEAVCALEYKDEPWKLMVMARLSAQCTDKRVNEVSLILFEKYKTPEQLASAEISDVEDIVKPCGLYRMKAKDIVNECRMLCDEFGGILPDDIDVLLRFPGVGRKIANLLVGDIYGKSAFVADTHCIRISGRLGLTPDKTKDPLKVEMALRKILPGEEGSDFCHRLVNFGRDVCTARSPKCEECRLREFCIEKGSE